MRGGRFFVGGGKVKLRIGPVTEPSLNSHDPGKDLGMGEGDGHPSQGNSAYLTSKNLLRYGGIYFRKGPVRAISV